MGVVNLPSRGVPSPTETFNAAKDAKLINGGSHFFCRGHLSAVRIKERSEKDKRYCNQCFDLIHENVNDHEPIRWENLQKRILKDGTSFIECTATSYSIIDGSKFGITKTGQTICFGKIRGPDKPIDPHQTPSDEDNGCHIIWDGETPTDNFCTLKEDGIMLHQKRGPKYKEYPEDLIIELSKTMKPRKAARVLTKEHGVPINHMTIRRILSGERQLPLEV